MAVLVIEESATEATLLRAALARWPGLEVVLSADASPVALAIAGSAALSERTDELKSLQDRGIPVVGIAAPLPAAVKQRALAAGVREIHERPAEWRSYSELVAAVVQRFIRRD